MHIGSHLALDGLDRRAAQEPVRKSDTVASHVHEHATARSLDVPKPRRVGPEVFLALFHQVDFAERTFVRHLLGLDVLGSEEQFFGVHQQHTLSGARVDHFVGFLERHAQRFLADHMLPGSRRIQRHLRMQVVWRCDSHHLDVWLAEHLAIVAKYSLDPIAPGQFLGVSGCGRGNRHHLRFLGHDLKGGRVDVGLELRTDDTNFDSSWHR